MVETILEHDLEDILTPCRIHEAISAQAMYSFAMYFKPAPKGRKKGSKLGPYKITPQIQREMQRMRDTRKEDGNLRYNIADIARRFKVSQTSVKTYTRGTRPGRTGISDTTKSQIALMRRQGYTRQYVADSLGLSTSTVERYG